MEQEEVEQVSLLNNTYTGRHKKIIWGAITIAILTFAFFAFVFATASFATTQNLTTGVNNNFYAQQGGLIKATYPVVPNVQQFSSGTVMSFCDNLNSVCPGLGPKWNTTLYPGLVSLSPAILGGLVQLSPALAVYAWVSFYEPFILRFQALITDTTPPSKGTAVSINLPDSATWLALRAYSASSFVISYTSQNFTYLLGGAVSPTATINLGAPVYLFNITYSTYPFLTDVVVLNSAILVTYGESHAQFGASFLAYSLYGTSLATLTIANSPKYALQILGSLGSAALGNAGGYDWFLQATGTAASLGTFSISSNVLTLTFMKMVPFPNVLFDSITVTSMVNGYIVLAGVQTELLASPLAISLVLQWTTSAPYLNAFIPSNLLGTQQHQLVNNILSTCYAPPSSPGTGQGELFLAYVDSRSDRAKIARAKIAFTSPGNVQVLPSPPMDISTFTYTQYGTSIPPLVACPNPLGVLVAYQYLGTYFNTFVWEGGYQFAGIAQEAYDSNVAKNGVNVIRQGISSSHTSLQAGYPYYVSNSGYLRPHTSLAELFTSSSFNARIGVALSDYQLLIDPYVFES